jgi:formiminotetrahydrofolate cyclodeaminase
VTETTDSDHLAAEYLAAVASNAPVPGGGSVAATVGALAAALAEMVCQFSVGRHDDPSINAEIAAVLTRMAAARARLESLAHDDEVAYATYRAASDLPRSTQGEKEIRRRALQDALVGAANVPLATAGASVALLPDIAYIATNGNPHVRSDAEIAAILADAAVRASAVNVRVNTAMLKDRALATTIDSRIAEIEESSGGAVSVSPGVNPRAK